MDKPWTVGEWDERPCIKYPVEDLNGWQHWVPQNQYYLDGGAQADAELICHCVNTHQQLVDALERIIGIPDLYDDDNNAIKIIRMVNVAKAALAAEKGEK